METEKEGWKSSALQVNLERTAAKVEIPQEYLPLLTIVKDHYGVLKKATELLTELNHPFVNWGYVLQQLRTLSIGDFYEYNRHADGLTAVRIILQIYWRVIQQAANEEVKENGVRYLFDYMDTLLRNSNESLSRNLSLFPLVVKFLLKIADEDAFLVRKSSAYLKKLLKVHVERDIRVDMEGVPLLLYTLFKHTYQFWLTQPDPSEWFNTDGEGDEAIETFGNLVHPLSHGHLKALLEKLETLKASALDTMGIVAAYLDMPDYSQIVNGYLLIADDLERSSVYTGRQHLVKLDFLFNIMGVSGLSDIHGNVLREINLSLKMVFREENQENLNDFVKKVFSLLKKSRSLYEYRGAIIDCITTTAREVFEQNQHPLVDTFIEELISFGFQYPEVKGSTTEWQVRMNPAHIMNIRSWLEIISIKPRWTKRLLSALIINLKLGGIFVRDTDLIQKDISALLNSDIGPAYNLVKQLLRLFPVYFSEIGAEGELRDISTRVDELSYRNDKLVNFLRKQSHVESNSLLVGFVEDAFRYWYSRDKTLIKRHLPEEVYAQVAGSGEYFDGLHRIFKHLLPKASGDPVNFLRWDRARVQKELQGMRGVMSRDKERALLMIRFYQLLHKKYSPQHTDLLRDLEGNYIFDSSKVRALRRALHRKDYYRALTIILGFLEMLKGKVLSPEKTEYFENIYHKRHIAAGIPSMYGTYREEKFEAVGLSLRLESLATVLFEELIRSLNLKFITKSTLTMIHECLWLYIRALELEGIATEGLVAKIKYVTAALKVRQFSVDQYIDIFHFISKGVQGIIRDYYIDAHRLNLPVIVGQIVRSGGSPEADAWEQRDEKTIYRYSENFIRGMIFSAFGLQVFDNLINGVIETLTAELERFKDNKQILNLVMAYSPELAISSIYKKNKHLDNQILLGNKGYFLKELASFGFRVPPGFILTTEVFRGYDAVVGYKYIFKDLTIRISREITNLEKLTGQKFGDPRNPLLLSVRSGATISLPGMMNSFLNVGINEAIAEGLGKKSDHEWAAWDSYRRFLQTWGMYQDLNRDFFDEIINDFKDKYRVKRKIEFKPDQMKQIALAYKKRMADKGVHVMDNPFDQLREAILQVFASWYSAQAKIYRHQMRLSDEWGTAVIVQAMVFGNLNEDSGSGVIFTRDPKGMSPDVTPYGDFIFGVQGDDIVSGLVETYPISEKQRITEKRESGISLEMRFPEIYWELVRLSEILIYEKGFNHQEIEFTFEKAGKDKLYVLQTRDMVQRETKKLKRFRDTKELQASILGSGIGVSGGALCGRAVHSEEDIKKFRSTDPGTPLILIRPDTVPDDVGVLLQVEGLLTARGGGTSHAAVTIPQLNKVGVVGFSKLQVYEAEEWSTVDSRKIKSGDFIGIDGWSGAVYLGRHETESEESYGITL
ncbi:MAG: pyruvate, phosphate dikinase [Syntrophorhabdus aromaticivorans]|uniref:Pyruvate, phosphate dikinase n=1 Tax=Syntrophorhabdus aromaticivorans TaxID=328301 RepID=A0A971M248_9BACT|nr:pyruvate, phosphate dikinase [Syntrophorhabdus aromaticivorans]